MPRRAKGEGTIYQRPDGLWCGQVTIDYDPVTGKQVRRTVYGKTQDEVRQKILKLRTEEETPAEASQRLKNYLSFWLGTVKFKVGTKTYSRYEHQVNKISQHLGNLELGQLCPLKLANFYRSWTGTPQELFRTAKTLRQALEQAVRSGFITRNPSKALPLPSAAKSDITPLTKDEVARFLEAAKPDPYYALFLLALDTGARQGELFALTKDDLLATGEVSFTKSLEEHRGQFRVKDTKTKASRRRVLITDETRMALESHKIARNGLLFADSKGGYLRKSNFLRRHFKPILAKSGIRSGVRFHDLRHTTATLLLEAGVPVKVVAERLGHSSINITLGTYSHVIPGMQEKAVNLLSSILAVNGTDLASA